MRLLPKQRVTVADIYSQNGAMCAESLAGISSFGQKNDASIRLGRRMFHK
jgi:hypothetical protein